MSTDILFRPADGPCPSLDAHIESFVSDLRVAGYAEKTLRDKRRIVATFTRWMLERQVAVADLDESHLIEFLDRDPQRSTARHVLERAVLPQFLGYLRTKARVVLPDAGVEVSAAEVLAGHYAKYLRDERGLSDRTIEVYLPFIRGFLAPYWP